MTTTLAPTIFFIVLILIIMTIGIHRSQLKIVIDNLGPSSFGMLDSLQNSKGMTVLG